MRALVNHVDRLQRLAVFESAARLGSFTAAAGELGLSQPAVTRQIRSLEQRLGHDLFHRSANRSELSDTGRGLAVAIDVAFAAIEHAIDELSPGDDVFVLAVPPGFAQQLIVPRLDELQATVPDRDLRLWLYDREAELAAGTFDVAVRVGDTTDVGLEHHELFEERVVPVATPSLAETLGLSDQSTADEVQAAPLLHMEAEGRPWMSWSDWLAAFGLALSADPARRRLILNNYPTVVHQALAGRGVALGWRGIIDDFVDAGMLSIVGPDAVSGRSYRAVWPTGKRTESVDAVLEWLKPAGDG